MRASGFLIVAALLLAAIAGCATEPISASAAGAVSWENHLLYTSAHQGTVPVTIVRDEGLTASGCAARVLVNDLVAAYVRAAEKVTLHIPPGDYILGVDGPYCLRGLVEVEANVRLGKPRSYRIGFDADGATGLYPTVNR